MIPINGYNGYPYYAPYSQPTPQEMYALEQRQNEKRLIKRFSWGAAIATGAFFLLANALYVPAMLLFDYIPMVSGSENELTLQLSIDLLITVIALLVPFGIVYKLFRDNYHIRPINFGKSALSFSDTVLFVIAGLALTVLAGNVTGTLSTMFEKTTGIEFMYAFFNTPTSVLGIVLYFLRGALFPAIAEEFAMRGVVMNSLRRYGDGFAIFMSAMVFALMHGNMVQTPFALLAGLVLGYAAVKTGTIWTSIIIHLLNNSFSLVLSMLLDNSSEAIANEVSAIVTSVIMLLGLISIVLLAVRKKITKPAPNRSFLPNAQRYKYFILSIPMGLVLVYMVVQTLMTIALPDILENFDFDINWIK